MVTLIHEMYLICVLFEVAFLEFSLYGCSLLIVTPPSDLCISIFINGIMNIVQVEGPVVNGYFCLGKKHLNSFFFSYLLQGYIFWPARKIVPPLSKFFPVFSTFSVLVCYPSYSSLFFETDKDLHPRGGGAKWPEYYTPAFLYFSDTLC